MATITTKKLVSDNLPGPGGSAPYGNACNVLASIVLNSSGVFANSDTTTAVGATDKVRFGILPGGMRIDDCVATVSTTFRASTTAKIGFEYVDGTDDTNVPQDDDYFFAALALDAAGRTRANNTAVRPLVLPKDAYLIYTNAVAAQNGDGVIDVIVEGAVVGMP